MAFLKENVCLCAIELQSERLSVSGEEYEINRSVRTSLSRDQHLEFLIEIYKAPKTTQGGRRENLKSK